MLLTKKMDMDIDCRDTNLEDCCENLNNYQKQLYDHEQRWKQARMFHEQKMTEKDAVLGQARMFYEQKMTEKDAACEQARMFYEQKMAEKVASIEQLTDRMRRMNEQAKKFQANEAAWRQEQRRAADDVKTAEDAARAEGVRRSREEAERQRREFRAAKKEADKKVREEEAARKAKEEAYMKARRAAEDAERVAKEAAKAAKSRKEADIARKTKMRSRERIDEYTRRDAKEADMKARLEELAKALHDKYKNLSCADIVCSEDWQNEFMMKERIKLTKLKMYKKIYLYIHEDKVHRKTGEEREHFLIRKAMAIYWFKRLKNCEDEKWICDENYGPVQLKSDLSPRSAGAREGVEIVEVYEDNEDNDSLVRIEQKLDSLLSMMSELFENKTLSPKYKAWL